MMYTKVIILVLVIPIYSQQKMYESDNSTDITKGILSNGNNYENSDYVIDAGSEDGSVWERQTYCVRKCCPIGTAYDSTQNVCVDNSETFNPPIWNDGKLLRNVNATEMFHFVIGKINCTFPEYSVMIRQVSVVLQLQLDGRLYVELPYEYPIWTLLYHDNYCIDNFVYSKGIRTVIRLDGIICKTPPGIPRYRDYDAQIFKTENSNMVGYWGMLTSCVFILATVTIYAWLPELRNLHGRVFMAYLMCLFAGFIFMSTMQILVMVNISVDTCVGLTFVIYFSLLSAFFWLNVMCYDIWWTFSGKRGLSRQTSVNASFGAYAAYAFSVPFVLTVILATLMFSGLPLSPFLPRITRGRCFLYGSSKLLYFYGPIAVLCVANMVFFVLTAIKINSVKKQTSVLKSEESAMHDQHRNDKQRFMLYIKLFVVMGISWLFEVISAIYPEADFFWRYTDAYNALIGFTIFVIFVCNRKIFRLIKKRCRQVRGISRDKIQPDIPRTRTCRDEILKYSVETSI